MNKALTALMAMGLVAGLSALFMSEPFARLARRVDERMKHEAEPHAATVADAGVGVAAPPVMVGGGRDQLAVKALQILTTYCARCHAGHGEGQGAGGLDYLLDRDALVAHKQIVAGKPGASPLWVKMQRHDEPPRGEQPRPSAAEIALLEAWITEGAPVPEVGSGKGRPNAFVSTGEVERAVFDDLESLAADERSSARYFSLAHLYNRAAPSSEQEQTRTALARILERLRERLPERSLVAAKPEMLAAPVAIDPTATVVRVDLRKLGWSAETWKRVVAAYPFAVVRGTMREAAIREATGCEVAVVRADWFIDAASRAPLAQQLREVTSTSTSAAPDGRDGGVDDASREPSIAEVARRYESEIDLRGAAAELGLVEIELVARAKKNPRVPAAFAALVEGKAPLSRAAMVAEFPAVLVALGLGAQPAASPVAPAAADAGD